MMMTSAKSLDQVLDALSRRDLLQSLAFLQRRQAGDAILQRLLQDRLTQLTSAPATRQDDELMTVPDVAARLKLGRARVYELVRQGRLPKVQFGKQIRIPSRALYTNQTKRPAHDPLA
jgi:excisionase family DNA binding protein